MKMNVLQYFFIIFYLTSFCDNIFCFPFSDLFNNVKSNTWCYLFECCNKDHIPARFDLLQNSLDEKLYGQHLAKQIVLHTLVEHFMDEKPKKALTLSFHGGQGTGKNYFTDFIKEAVYKSGSMSKFVHQFTARVHFLSTKHLAQDKSNLQNWLKGNISICERSLFIFDEVHKMPEGLIDVIKPMLDYNDLVDRVDYRKAVFIFLSNTGDKLITERLLQLWQNGVKRDDITLHDFEQLLTKGAFNEKGGFVHSDTIKHNLIDHYIPFLPLEKEHVVMCIKDSFRSRGIDHVTNEHIEEVMKVIEWGPEPINIYSTTGCKRISQKVTLVIRQFGLRMRKTEF